MKIKKRLLVFASTFPRWENDTLPPFVYELSKRLTSDFDVHVLAPHYPGAKRFEVMDGMKVYRFRYFIEKYQKLAGSGGILPTLKKNKLFYFQVPFFMLSEIFSLYRLTKKIKPDVIHAHWIIPQGFTAAINKKLTGVPYVVTTHGGDIFGLQGKFPTFLKKFTLKNAKNITVVSTAIKEEINKKIDPNLNVKVIPMGVDLESFKRSSKESSNIKKNLGLKGPVLIFVGRLVYEKGVDILLEAFYEVEKKYPQINLLIIGSGPMEDELKNKVHKLKLNSKVFFLGWINNNRLRDYYSVADIFIGPSRMEGFGLTFLEASVSGCYVLGPQLGGIPEIIKKGNGSIIDTNKKNILDKIVEGLKKDKKHFKKNNLQYYDWSNISKYYSVILNND